MGAEHTAQPGAPCEVNGLAGTVVLLNGVAVCQPSAAADAKPPARAASPAFTGSARPVYDAATALKAKNDAYAAMCQETQDAWRND